MDYPKQVIAAAEKAFIKELGELSRNAARGIANGKAIRNAIAKMNEKIIAARKIGITEATPLDEERINKLFNYIEPLTAFSFQSNEMRNTICEEIANYFSTFTKIEEKYLAEINFPEKR